ncbi:hypothetical protein SKAU_G00319530 [Synaphobranchus kaupii]|uniref:Uncharacterized protein n=1 Tax=Synaphobranchus kaupii TaxID=118154 RepID=A0A9Q1ENL4_SYNKA|nr:hypothetical protein SKAU_G00319530 [Synaphobranchus kaupii]
MGRFSPDISTPWQCFSTDQHWHSRHDDRFNERALVTPSQPREAAYLTLPNCMGHATLKPRRDRRDSSAMIGPGVFGR